MKYQPPTGGAANDSYVGRNLGAGIQGSRVPPKAIEHPQRELIAVIQAAGITPSDTDLDQVLEALNKLYQKKEVGSFILLDRINITSSVAAVDWAIPAGYDFMRITALLRSSTQAVNMRISKDNGSTYLAGATDYSAGYATVNGATTWGVSSGANSSVLQLCDLFDIDANGFSTSVVTFHRGGASLKPQSFGSSYGATSFGLKSAHFMSRAQANGLATNLRFLASSGNMIAGSQIIIEGLKVV